MQRKLTVILSADVVGYSALMQRDEAGTLARLKENRSTLFDPCVTAHGGRIFKVMGDGVLIEFSSAAAAVTCALEIQQAMEGAEAAQPEPERLRYRVGINLGDVIIEGDDIYGDGVNVAARLQALAPVGGVALSRHVRDQVAGKVAAEFEDLGPHQVKNIEGPVHVFTARPQREEHTRMQDAQGREKISVCVLPFANMSGDQEQEYFSDGISEDIITDLSKLSALSVIARNSAFAFKGKNVDLIQVARQLNVDYVLEGSVRKAGGRVRITAQLIDGAKNDHVWAERYDRDLDDIFALQDEISQAIVDALRVKLLPEEKKTGEQRRGTDSAEAYNLFLMARQEYLTGFEGDPRRIRTIIRLCEGATQIDPNYARAWALMATAQVAAHHAAGVTSDTGLAAAERALSIDPNLAEAHSVRSRIYLMEGKLADAVEECNVALRLDPGSYEVNRNAALVHFNQRDFAAAIPYYAKAVELFEWDFGSASMLVTCYTALGDHEAARAAAEVTLARVEKVLAQDRNNGTAMGHGSDALAVLGQGERAKEWMQRALLIDPDNWGMRYNFACCLAVQLKDTDAALEMLRPVLMNSSRSRVDYAKIDPDFDGIRDDPRFQALMAEAEARASDA